MGGRAGRPPCVCAGRSAVSKVCCVLWYFAFPLVLVWHSIRIYFLACLTAYAIGACGKLWLCVGRTFCCCFNCRCFRKCSCCICLRYEDGDFPASARSVGKWKGLDEKSVNAQIEWRRGDEICELDSTDDHARLFSGEIEPADIAQGQLGDCWLMTALACLAEYPGAIQRVFLTDEYNPRGRYVLQLYCGESERFEKVVIDDMIPVNCGSTTPIFARPNGKELWVALLEKAFAKFAGDYNALDGGYPLWGLQALTGDEVSAWKLESGRWRGLEIRYNKDDGGRTMARRKRKIDVKFCARNGCWRHFCMQPAAATDQKLARGIRCSFQTK